MTVRELREWEAYYAVSPLSRQWADTSLTGGGIQPKQSVEDQKAIFARAQRAFAKKRKAR